MKTLTQLLVSLLLFSPSVSFAQSVPDSIFSIDGEIVHEDFIMVQMNAKGSLDTIMGAFLKYQLSSKEVISIALYDMADNLIEILVEQEEREQGHYEDRVITPPQLPSGQYKLVISNKYDSRTVIMIK